MDAPGVESAPEFAFSAAPVHHAYVSTPYHVASRTRGIAARNAAMRPTILVNRHAIGACLTLAPSTS
jgi:hypothetical protein